MLDLDRNQRSLIADKLVDAANIAAGGMVVGQFLAERPFSLPLAVIGLGVWGALFALGVALQGRSAS